MQLPLTKHNTFPGNHSLGKSLHNRLTISIISYVNIVLQQWFLPKMGAAHPQKRNKVKTFSDRPPSLPAWFLPPNGSHQSAKDKHVRK